MPEDLTSSSTVRPAESPVAAKGPEHNEDWSDSSDADTGEPVLTRRGWIRLAWAGAAVVIVVLLVTLPPLLNVNRYQRRVAQAISGAIGRPVHFDSIRMHLLPLPGFTIQNFVVQEDPAFGVEPALRSNVVQARVRFGSLWRRRVEISSIRLEAPSVNLVRRADGRWNLQGIVLQASQLESAPTAQLRHSDAPRFPYIEAVDARINIKQGDEKLPWSLLDAKFALWLPNQNEWRLRLEGRPLRTDTDVSDVGTLRVEGTLGRGGNGVSGEKLDLRARLDSTPMGEAAKLVLGHDTDWRGAASADLTVHGTPAALLLTTDVHLHNLRRADFVPRLPMSVDAHCEGEALESFHQLHAIRCGIPTTQSTSLLDVVNVFEKEGGNVFAAPDVLSVVVEVPNTLDRHSATITADLQRGSPEWALGWLRLFSTRLPAEEQVGGYITVHAQRNGGGPLGWQGTAVCHCTFPRRKSLVANPAEDKSSEAGADRTGETSPSTARANVSQTESWNVAFSHAPGIGDAADTDTVSINAGPEPVEALPTRSNALPTASSSDASAISGQIGHSGYTLQYASADIARYAASLLPPLGDGLSADLGGPLQAERKWSGSQTWTAVPALPVHPTRKIARHRSR